MDFKEMDYDELRNLIDAANTEFAKRRRSMQEDAWEAVKQAICEYTHEFGDIVLDHGEYHIPSTCNFSTMGSILTYEVEIEEY